MNWPIGNAEQFRGVYDLQRKHLLLYEREMQGQYRAPVDVSDLDDPDARELIGEKTYAHFLESLDLIRAAGTTFDIGAYLAGRQTPVFFGSAMTNFGLEPFLRALVELAPPPQPRPSDIGHRQPDRRALHRLRVQDPGEHGPAPSRSRRVRARLLGALHEGHGGVEQPRGQADPRHARLPLLRPRPRDDHRGLRRRHHRPRQPRAVRHRRHAAYAERALQFLDIPRFPAEHFGRLRLQDTRYKQFDEGLRQLEEEGLMQVFYVASGRREPIVGVVGALQFDVIASRLRTEYGVEIAVDPSTFTAARWVADPAKPLPLLGGATTAAVDRQERRVLLFATEWEVQYFEKQNPGYGLLAESPVEN